MGISEKFRCRLARPADLDWCDRKDTLLPRETLERKIEMKQIFLAEAGGKPEGCLRIEYLWSTVPYISVVFVQEAFQRQGVGRALLEFVEDYLRQKGYEILLSSSTVTEPEPQAWHRAVGFRECGLLSGINGNGIGEIFFSKALA